MAGEQLEELIGCGLAVVRLDRPGNCLRISTTCCSAVFACLRPCEARIDDIADPEDVPKPQVAQLGLGIGQFRRHASVGCRRCGGWSEGGESDCERGCEQYGYSKFHRRSP
jgi:hypothetical protein